MSIATPGINRGPANVSNATITQVVKALPTTLPAQAGVLWNNGGVLSIS